MKYRLDYNMISMLNFLNLIIVLWLHGRISFLGNTPEIFRSKTGLLFNSIHKSKP